MERRTRVRFAPSPTGPLHMGGVRTALYNYLFVKQRGGDFIIRIEDTDSHRFVPGAEQYIIEALGWCGIIPDEGVDMATGQVVETPSERHPHAPYRQSQRKPIYRKYAEQLVAAGKAYYAFDSASELDERRQKAESAGETFIYNQKTRMQLRNSLTLPAEETTRLIAETTDWTIRFKMPENTVVKMDDLIRGHIEMNTDTLDDKVLWKRADELPTYHLANIVDDHLMEITEVIRGEEWLPSLPLHYQLYEAFGWTSSMPRFAHLSLLLKPVGNGKLSKRDGDKMGFPVFPLQWISADGTASHGYREDGYFPEAFVNMLALLGWNPGDDRELFTLDELVQAFSMDKVQKAGAKFNPEKAKWFNKEYLRQKSVDELTDLFIPILSRHGVTGVSRSYAWKVVELVKERASFVEDFWTIASYLFIAPSRFGEFGVKAGAAIAQKPLDPRAKVYDDTLTAPFLAKDVEKFWTAENAGMARETVQSLSGKSFANAAEMSLAIETFIKEREWPMGKVMNTLRLALTGSASGLGIADIIHLVGVPEALSRLDFAAQRLS